VGICIRKTHQGGKLVVPNQLVGPAARLPAAALEGEVALAAALLVKGMNE
jgi:hypothetical protein